MIDPDCETQVDGMALKLSPDMRWLTVADLAAILGLRRQTIYTAARQVAAERLPEPVHR